MVFDDNQANLAELGSTKSTEPSKIGESQEFYFERAPATAPSPLSRLVARGHELHQYALERFASTYPRIIDIAWRTLRLIGLSLAIIFVVGLASFTMAFSHWLAIVVGHFVLRYTCPESLSTAFRDAEVNNTLIFATVGALLVNIPPFAVFVLSFPLTFDRTVVEGSTRPAQEFIERVTPKNRYARLFLKYTPRLLAAPLGCYIVWFAQQEVPKRGDIMLVPVDAFFAGLAGEITFSSMGYVKNWRVVQGWLEKKGAVGSHVSIEQLPPHITDTIAKPS